MSNIETLSAADAFFTSESYSKPRTPDALYQWAMITTKRLGAKAYKTHDAHLLKKFYDELYPLTIFAKREYGEREDVLISPNLGSEGFDAKIEITTESAIQTLFVEITYAKDGHDQSLRIELLERDGTCSLTGLASAKGKRGSENRRVSVLLEADEHTTSCNKALDIVKKRLQSKSLAKYGPDYILLVAVDDYFPFCKIEDMERLNVIALHAIDTLSLNFGRLVFVGVAGKVWLSYSLQCK